MASLIVTGWGGQILLACDASMNRFILKSDEITLFWRNCITVSGNYVLYCDSSISSCFMLKKKSITTIRRLCTDILW